MRKVALLLVLASCAGSESTPGNAKEHHAAASRTEPVSACSGSDPLRWPWFGDLHVHTTLSADAYVFGTRNRPDDAYRFARGGVISLAAPGFPDTRLERPLDFAAVTDHAEYLGSSSLCRDPESSAYATPLCREYRASAEGRFTMEEVSRVLGRVLQEINGPGNCGADGRRCLEAELVPWRETREAAARWNEPCKFSTFVAYEYSASPELSNLHRNVIFRNETVPDHPLGWNDAPTALGLWRWLRDACIEAGTGCDAVAIPHNSNLSDGRMFTVDYGDAKTPGEQAAVARLRASVETAVEVMQMKGQSECRNGMWQVAGGPDELCDFENYREWPSPPPASPLPDCHEGTGAGALLGRGCISRLDFVRYALIEGLREKARIGVNPYRFGFIGSTDAHDGTAGQVDEWAHEGVSRPPEPRNFGRGNPGGLAGLWAEENTRESLFAALQRREIFATSGPRMSVRFFAGWGYDAGLCSDPELVRRGYEGGVPMGGSLRRRPGDASPSFVVSALRDSGSPAHPRTLLQRAQIVKGWVGDDGQFYQAVYDVAGSAANGAGVDPANCQIRGPGLDSLCGVWRDPDFDADRQAVYYARVLENPTCRYTTPACRNLPEAERPADCANARLPAVIQERAWTSPVWYEPEGSASPIPRRS